MSHGPFGLGGASPAGVAIVNVAPISVSVTATISTTSILFFMSNPVCFALPVLRHFLFLPGGGCPWASGSDRQPDRASGQHAPNIPAHVPGCSGSGSGHNLTRPPIREFRL